MKELEVGDNTGFTNFFRLTKEQFYFVVEKVGPLIAKEEQPSPINNVRTTIQPDERLAVTLRFLATGESFHSLEYSFRISRQTISTIVTETCQALYEVLPDKYFRTPRTEEWKKIAESFHLKWNLPNGLGAIDGKRIVIQQHAKSGSHFFDYKGNNSVVLLAVFGPEYLCLWASLGANGRSCDAGIWQLSDFKFALESVENSIKIPLPTPLPVRSNPVPFLLTCDDAFALISSLINPFP